MKNVFSRAAIFLEILSLGMSVGLAVAQTVDPNPAHKPDVFLSNEKKSKKEKTPTSRTLTGQVTDETGQPLEGALVTLTDDKTKEKTTFFTKRDGRYRFEELAFNNDYQIRARYKTHDSDTRKLSQYDHLPQVVRILQVDTETPPASATTAGKTPNPQH